MKLNHEGMSLWYGTADAPAPGEKVDVGRVIEITIGVQPTDASNAVQLFYRVNSGMTVEKPITARFLRRDYTGQTQYFIARFPPDVINRLRANDLVEYAVVCRCAGRQVPSSDDKKEFVSAFRISGTDAKSIHNVEPIRSTLRTTVSETSPSEVHKLEANKPSKAVGEMSKGKATAIVDKVTATNATSLINTSPLQPIVINKFLNLYQKYNYVPSNAFWTDVSKDADLSGHIEDLQFTILLGNLTLNNLPLVKELQLLHQAGTIKRPQDLVKVDWSTIIGTGVANGTIQIPTSVSGGTLAEKTQNYIAYIVKNVDSTYPSAAFSRDLSNSLIGGAGRVAVFGHQMAQAISTFLETCQDFDLGTIDVRSYLLEHRAVAFGGIDVSHPQFTSSLTATASLQGHKGL